MAPFTDHLDKAHSLHEWVRVVFLSSVTRKKAAQVHMPLVESSFWKRGAGAHMYLYCMRFGIRRRKVVVVEGKKPGEQEEVFIHLSCPVPSIMSHSRALSIQPADQVPRLMS